MQETAKFIGFGFDLNGGTGIMLDVLDMTTDLVFDILHSVIQIRNDMLLLENFQELFALIEFDYILDYLIDAVLEAL